MGNSKIDYWAVFRDSPSPTVLLDREFIIAAANDACLRVSERRPEEMVGKSIFDLFPSEPVDPEAKGCRTLRESLERVLATGERSVVALQKQSAEMPGRPGAFRNRYWSQVTAPVFGPDGKVELIIHQAEEVTGFLQWLRRARRLADPGIRADLEAMENQVYARSFELQEFNERLQHAHEQQRQISLSLRDAVERQRRFVSDISHDLRNPLTGLQLRLEEALSDPETDVQEVLHSVLRDAQRLNDLVSDLLELTRLDAHKPIPSEPIDLGGLVSEELKRHAFKHRPLSCASPGVVVCASRIRLTRLLANLLTNADRHASREIRVTVEAVPPHAVLEVADDGPGIPPEERELVFERFHRSEEARRKDPGGSGLGLPISREIAETYGGTLELADNPSGGARFVLRLPLCPGEQAGQDLPN
ncbi:ATP-binding protein [Actinocorallia sp. B10E7]|uniref:ATP-binding protein n=1 Tax=Actinocorallia sp. B10E7 TaxID=3153558 RepID=UPI00325D6F3D